MELLEKQLAEEEDRQKNAITKPNSKIDMEMFY
jgi:hypothetical protein